MCRERVSVRRGRVYGALCVFFLLLCVLPFRTVRGQDVEDFYARMLEQEVEVLNPVKRPVLGLGVGVLLPYGDIRYLSDHPISSSWACRVNVSTLVGKSKQVKLNVAVLYGLLEGQDHSKSLIMNQGPPLEVEDIKWYPSTAFRTEIIEIGVSGEYNFWHLIGTQKSVRPYIAAGAGLMIFTPKVNYRNEDGDFYHYWDDGTVRLEPQSEGSASTLLVRRDRQFETDFKRYNIFELKSIPPVTGFIPLEFGVDLYVSDRIAFRPFVGWHLAFTDLLDAYNKDIASQYEGLEDKLSFDMFFHTGFSFQFDFFSQAESFIVDKVFADIEEFDYEVFFSDEDGDGIFDHMDQCPDTEPNVPVDSVGCPLDSDHDGVPDYLDKELHTPPDTPVNEHGESLDDSERTLPRLAEPPVRREEVRVLPVSMIWNRNYEFEGEGIPEKFKGVDIDGDGEISYEEVVRAVDDYFAGLNDFTPDDIYELNAYFFSQ